MSSQLADNRPSHKPHGELVYVFQFLNPFDSSQDRLMNQEITIKEARSKFFKIYKTTEEEPNPALIPRSSSELIEWLNLELSESAKQAHIKKKDFHVAVISSVLFSLKHELDLSYTLLESRDQDEVFCKIFVTDDWVLRNAKANEYEVQLKKKEKHVHPFQEVSPYIGADILDHKKDKALHFKHYDQLDQESENGSLSIFTSTDRRRLVLKVLKQRIDLPDLKASGVMVEDFCVHEKNTLEDLKSKWGNFLAVFKSQPLDYVRNYFAEKVAMYFAWIDVYWKFMMSAAVVGLITSIAFFIIDKTKETKDVPPSQIGFQVFYAVFLAFWASSFEQIWTRQENRLAWRWGTTNLDRIEDQRTGFRGVLGKDEVSGKMKILPDPNEWKFLKKSISFIVIFFFMSIVLVWVACIFYLRFYLLTNGYKKLGKFLPAFLNAIQIKILNLLYGKVVTPLNEWENYETENQDHDNLAFKRFIFRFVNSYTALFYMAFLKEQVEARYECELPDTILDACPAESMVYVLGCKDCMKDLGFQLSVIFITNMCMNVVELGLPWFKYKLALYLESRNLAKKRQQNPNIRENLYPGEFDSKLEAYENPADDYMEMIIQFGFVALFGVSSPIIAILALIEITLEIRVDAWKICTLTKRPDPHRTNNIGVWKMIIITVAYVGAVTNSAIIVFTSKLFIDVAFSYKLIYFLLIEHTMLGVMYIVGLYVDDVPTQVIQGLAWGKRKLDKYYFNKATNLNATSKFRESQGGDAFFVGQKDFHYEES